LEAFAYNEDVIPLVGDPEMLKSLRLNAPQWLQQSMNWPSLLERRVHAGISTYDQRAGMLAWLDAALEARPLPPELTLNAVEMRNWLVLYSDWARDAGADAFVMRFTLGGYALHVTEAPTNLIVLARAERPLDEATLPMRGSTSGEAPTRLPAEVQRVMRISRGVLRPYLLPASEETVIFQEQQRMTGAYEGSWQPGGKGQARLPLASDLPPLAIRFFIAGDLVAFNINKTVWATADNARLYGRRFEAPQDQQSEMNILTAIQDETLSSARLGDPSERIAFYERLRRTLNIKTVEEFLGPMLYDSQGQRLTAKQLDYTRLLTAIETLSQDQRDILLRQRSVDYLYVEGLKAFEKDDIDLAIDQWSRALAEDPLNVRMGLLLRVAKDIKVEREFGGDRLAADKDLFIDNINEVLAFHSRAIMRRAETDRGDERLRAEVLEMRNRAIELYRQGMHVEALTVWKEILRRDPNNGNAMLWTALLQGRSNGPVPEEVPGGRLRQATTPVPTSTPGAAN